MTLTTGTRVGTYEIIAALGAGGMGEVYRARDARLNRDVALKILPDIFASDPDRLARFEREAQVLASLNHPHIAQIYGIVDAGSADVKDQPHPDNTDDVGRVPRSGPPDLVRRRGPAAQALVMEFVDGETLADRIARGPIPIDEALPIARQIVDALEAAHEQGIIHRDLKPANIKVRGDGTVKVLDYGLAKLAAPAATAATTTASLSPTITSPALTTGVGMLLGTAAYMSPEQAKGRDADKRSDIWAFGCVLYEMLTGRRAFDGEDVSDTLANILKMQPDWNALPASAPSSIRRLLRRALEKDRRRRLADAGDARLEIEEAVDSRSDDVSMPATRSTRRLHLTWAAVAAGVAVSVALGVGWYQGSAPAPPELRLQIATPPTSDATSMAVSPDGQWIVFQGDVGGRHQLWLRGMGATDARPLEQTDDAFAPFWSPDSRSIAFYAAGELKRIDLDSGTVTRVLDRRTVFRGGTWNAAGDILFVGGTNVDVFRVPSTGGEAKVVVTFPVDRGVFQLHSPQFLPDGNHFLVAATGRTARGGPVKIYVAALDGSPPRPLLDANNPKFAVAAPFVFVIRQGTLFAQRLAFPAIETAGDARPIAENVTAVSAAMSSSTRTLLLSYRSGTAGPRQRQLVWVTRSGMPGEKLGDPYPATAGNPAMSHDGATVAVAAAGTSPSDLWLLDTTRGLRTRFTSDPVIDNSPVWSPDDTRIVFQSNPNQVLDLYQQSVNGDGALELVLATNEPKMATDWRGNILLYQSEGQSTGFDLWALPLDTRKPRVIVQTPYEERNGQFSPDGKWIAYDSDESGQTEIYVRPFDRSGRTIRISTMGGAQPRWRPDGRELFYIALDDKLMAVPLGSAGDRQTLEPGVPVPLFVTHVGGALQNLTLGVARQQYTVSRDGSRFLMNEVVEQDAGTTPINVILNWRGDSGGPAASSPKP